MIDVIVPVYAGEAFVRRCLTSVLASGGVGHELVVVDDCSPEPALSAWLAELAAEGRIRLLRNERNRGFVGSVNRALALHAERDVVLLNSDTEVAGDWLARLARCAAEHPDAGTITPFSNNATICSYPFEAWAGELPGTLGLAALDAVFARTLTGVAADLPTGVGFCMFVRRACLDRVGALDEVAFGRGYGEENDLCRRAAKAGWRNLLCADVFVYHKGGVSFGPEREALMAAGAAALRRLHPEYDALVRDFITADPLRPLRDAVDAARADLGEAEAAAVRAERAAEPVGGVLPPPAPRVLRSYAGMERCPIGAAPLPVADARPVWLHLVHGWGGGTERWVRDMAAADASARHLCLRSRTGRNDAAVRLELLEPGVSDAVVLAWDLEEAISFCAVTHAGWRTVFDAVLANCGVQVVVVSSVIGHSLEAFDSGRPTLLVMHDLFPFCPALFGWYDEACVSCDGARLTRCFDGNRLNVFWHQARPQAWLALREAFAQVLVRRELTVVAPTRSVFERYRVLLPEFARTSWHVLPHGLALCPPPLARRTVSAEGGGLRRLRVVVPGRLSPHKGLGLVRELLPALADFAELLLLGSGDAGKAFDHLPHVRVVAEYGPMQMAAHVAAFGADCALLPSVLPESFSYTLSEMEALAVPAVATRLGAFAERIEDGVSGWLVAPGAAAMLEILRKLAAEPQRVTRAAAVLRGRPVRTAAQMAADYHALLPPLLAQVGQGDRVLLWQTFAGVREARAWLDFRVQELDEVHRTWRGADAGLRGHAEALDAALGVARDEAYTLRQRLAQVESELRALRASTSWRLTAPLRALIGTLRRGSGRVQDPAGSGDAPAGACAGTDSRLGQVVGGSQGDWRGDWQGRWAAALGEESTARQRRATLRRACRDALGVPDVARLVVGIGQRDGDRGLVDFARAAESVAVVRNGVVFVWLAMSDHSWAGAAGEALHLPLAGRHLFIRKDEDFEPWLLAADVYLSYPAADGGDSGAAQAAACGLPVLVGIAAKAVQGPPTAAEKRSVATVEAVLALLAQAGGTAAPAAGGQDGEAQARDI